MTDLKRRLTDIKFEHEGAHVALVGKHQGGPANGITTLVTKATHQIDQKLIDKATEVTVTLEFEEFLRKFFNMYWEDAEVLARALGFSDDSEDDAGFDYYKEYIDERVAQINIMKAVYKAQNVEQALGELSPDEMLSLLQSQEVLEKAMSKALEPTGETIQDNLEVPPMDTILKSAHEELLTKAVDAAVAVEKAKFDEQSVVLKAALDKVEAFELAAAEAVTKARKDSLVEAGQTTESAEEIVKSLAGVGDEAFAVVLKGYELQKAAEATNPLFKEQGVAGVGEPDAQKVDKVAEILKQKYQSVKPEIK